MLGARRILAALAMAACSLAATTLGAVAHPHVWITVETTVLYDKGTFTGLQHKWTFDEFYTAMAIEGLDKNKDGTYDREELSELAKVNIDGLKEFAFFTYPVLDGQDVKVADAKDYWLEHKNGALSLYFTVPFVQPVPVRAKNFAYVVQDPVFYIAFLPAKADPVKLGEGAPKSCKVHIGNPAGDDSDRLAKAFAQLATPVSATKAISIECPEDPLAPIDAVIAFEYNSMAITSKAAEDLRKLAADLNDPRRAGEAFLIEGHTDGKGRPRYNLELSRKRAETVRAYLMANFAIDGARLVARGVGTTRHKNAQQPLAAENRRVHILNHPKDVEAKAQPR